MNQIRTSFTGSLILAFLMSFHGLHADDPTVQELREVEKKVQNTVSKVMESVVSIADGGGQGSGIVVSSDGLVLTAGHVMSSSRGEIEILFPSGRTARARALGKNLNVDAGMIQIIDPGPWPYVDIASKDANVGDWVVSLGHSGGYLVGRKPPVRTGRIIERRDFQLVSDAVLIGGDSGGPLFNLDGELVAIHSSIGDTIAENRHITISTFKQYWTRLRKGETWGKLPELDDDESIEPVQSRARLGVIVERSQSVARINTVHPDSPADRAGLRVGDYITEFDSVRITGSRQLIDLIKTKKPGEPYWVEISRGRDQVFRLQIVLDKFDEQ